MWPCSVRVGTGLVTIEILRVRKHTDRGGNPAGNYLLPFPNMGANDRSRKVTMLKKCSFIASNKISADDCPMICGNIVLPCDNLNADAIKMG